MAMHYVYTLSVLSLSPSILSGTDSEGLGGPLSRSFSMGDNILFEVKSNSRSKSQKQSVDKKGKTVSTYLWLSFKYATTCFMLYEVMM